MILNVRLETLKNPIKNSLETLMTYFLFNIKTQDHGAKKIAILIWMQFLNAKIKSKHCFKAIQKFHKFNVFIKTLKLRNF